MLDGSAVPKLIGATIPSVVGFAWDGKAWQQVPVQVDERDIVNPGKILHWPTANWPKNADGTDFTILVYTAPSTPSAGYTNYPTYTGSDSNPLFDANDQISFLSNDAGQKAPAATAAPPDTVNGIREEVKAVDPLNAGDVGYVYLFESSNAALSGGSAGTTGVHYDFSLDSGDYAATYKMGTGSPAEQRRRAEPGALDRHHGRVHAQLR